MNLIDKPIKENLVGQFKNYQFGMHEEMIANGLKYLLNIGLKYDEKIYNVEVNPYESIPDILYTGMHHYAVKNIRVKLFEGNHFFMNINLPIVLFNSFFQLNGVYYIPINYIADEPIVRKEHSLFLSSTFKSITIYFRDSRVIFMGHNIQLVDFLQVMTHTWNDDVKKLIESELKIDIHSKSMKKIVEHLSNKLHTTPDIFAVQQRIEELFFDDWTKDLYQRFYNIAPTIENVLKLGLQKWIYDDLVSFIDLRYKRLTFIEPILKPYFKSISAAVDILLKGGQPRNLSVKMDSIIKQGFFNSLDGNVLYDTVNGFSATLSHKASFKNPFGKSKLPKEVSSIHFTHRGRICTSSISNQKPGQIIQLIPDQKIDFRYGIFEFSDKELESFRIQDAEIKRLKQKLKNQGAT